jgi:hydroxymethylbilane synthase
MHKSIRIGTRNSKLALWQAHSVGEGFTKQELPSTLVEIISDGEINTEVPLYSAGIQGIFTKALDIALLENNIDVAVHSYKDVPTLLAEGLQVAAVLTRGNPFDLLIAKGPATFDKLSRDLPLTIATSSIRRKAQWLYRYANSTVVNIRGNVQTRLKKLKESDWDGTILASAGIERLGLTEKETGHQQLLDWMLPAPAQGAIVIVCRKGDREIINACKPLNDYNTEVCTRAERDFLRILQGGCSTPISARATINNGQLLMTGNITATDGSDSLTITAGQKLSDHITLAQQIADRFTSHANFDKLLK